jgi:hypothetical protein
MVFYFYFSNISTPVIRQRKKIKNFNLELIGHFLQKFTSLTYDIHLCHWNLGEEAYMYGEFEVLWRHKVLESFDMCRA